MRAESFDDRIDLIRRMMPLMERIHISEVNFLADSRAALLSAVDVKRRWDTFLRKLAETPARDHFFNFYIHLPFCSRICNFCVYPVKKPRSLQEVRTHVRTVREELESFSGTFRDVVFQNIYVGGGTPSYLDDDDLREIVSGMRGLYKFADGGVRIIECLPGSMSRGKIDLFKELGFNRLSMGVQSLEERVLRSSRRPYGSIPRTLDIIRYASDLEGINVNVDLLVGLHGDNQKNFLRTLRRIIPLGPDHITVYRFQPPRPYLWKYFGKNYSNYQRHFKDNFGRVRKILLDEAEKGGYEIDNPRESKQGWQITRKDFRPVYDGKRCYEINALSGIQASCLAIGEFSRSHMFGEAVYEHGDQEGRPFDPSEKIFSFRSVSLEHEMIRHVYYHLYKYRAIDPAKFRKIFGVSLEQTFGPVIAELKRRKMLRSQGRLLRFPSEDVNELFIASRLFLDRRTLVESFKGVDTALVQVESEGRRYFFKVGYLHPGGFHTAEKGDRALFAVNEKGGEIAHCHFDSMQRILSMTLGKLFMSVLAGDPGLTSPEIVEAVCRLAGRKEFLGRLFPGSWRVSMRPAGTGS